MGSRDRHLVITAEMIEVRGYEMGDVVLLLKQVRALLQARSTVTPNALHGVERKLAAMWEVLEDIDYGLLSLSSEVGTESVEVQVAERRSREMNDCETNCCPTCCGCGSSSPKNDTCWCGMAEKWGADDDKR